MMSISVYYLISAVLALFILYDLFLMSSPKTAVRGNLIGAFAILAAIVVTLFYYRIVTLQLLWICMAIGTLIGLYLGSKVKMIQMPEMVAFLHGLGGAAAVLLAITVLLNAADISVFTIVTGTLALAVGGLTFSGSMIAAAKLHQIISSKPVVFPGHSTISALTVALLGLLVIVSGFLSGNLTGLVLICLAVSVFFGFWFTIRVGGADMPITISLLNSCSGVTGAMVGLATYDPMLAAGGGIVASAGLLLTQIMCRGMNRSLLEVLSGKTTVQSHGGKNPLPEVHPAAITPEVGQAADQATANLPNRKTAGEILSLAQSVIIVPGYGMALAQAQSEVKQLADLLEKMGKKVDFAIHPVAGRMPGHMNVLLAEVDVDYDKLFEMEEINPLFPAADLVLIVGANDVVNPAANTAAGTPIYGMPILNAYQGKNIIVCNFDRKPGYAGVDNPLYNQDNVLMMLGDAKASLTELLRIVQLPEIAVAETPGELMEMAVLGAAQSVIIVPGYGMALAQAQAEVKQLADILEGQGKAVSYAIHPVAGRMPGHMNVLLAEVDVDYDQLLEMEAVNPEFAGADLVIIVGANDVVNPAAITAIGTPIYGMPILKAFEAKKIIICNFDRKPGYAGVENPLYSQSNVLLLLGDAKTTVAGLVKLAQAG